VNARWQQLLERHPDVRVELDRMIRACPALEFMSETLGMPIKPTEQTPWRPFTIEERTTAAQGWD
jgi:hypothetical protein